MGAALVLVINPSSKAGAGKEEYKGAPQTALISQSACQMQRRYIASRQDEGSEAREGTLREYWTSLPDATTSALLRVLDISCAIKSVV